MMVYCVALNCGNRSAGPGQKTDGFYTFPKDSKLCQIWIDNLKRPGFKSNKHSRLCAKHFEPTCFAKDPRLLETLNFKPGQKRLKPGAIPTIFEQDCNPDDRQCWSKKRRAAFEDKKRYRQQAVASTENKETQDLWLENHLEEALPIANMSSNTKQTNAQTWEKPLSLTELLTAFSNSGPAKKSASKLPKKRGRPPKVKNPGTPRKSSPKKKQKCSQSKVSNSTITVDNSSDKCEERAFLPSVNADCSWDSETAAGGSTNIALNDTEDNRVVSASKAAGGELVDECNTTGDSVGDDKINPVSKSTEETNLENTNKAEGTESTRQSKTTGEEGLVENSKTSPLKVKLKLQKDGKRNSWGIDEASAVEETEPSMFGQKVCTEEKKGEQTYESDIEIISTHLEETTEDVARMKQPKVARKQCGKKKRKAKSPARKKVVPAKRGKVKGVKRGKTYYDCLAEYINYPDVPGVGKNLNNEHHELENNDEVSVLANDEANTTQNVENQNTSEVDVKTEEDQDEGKNRRRSTRKRKVILGYKEDEFMSPYENIVGLAGEEGDLLDSEDGDWVDDSEPVDNDDDFKRSKRRKTRKHEIDSDYVEEEFVGGSVQKRYKCDVCGHRTKVKHDLIKHKRKHTPDKPYTCPVPSCSYRTRYPNNIRHHMFTHTEERPYACTHCDLTFKRDCDLKAHIQRLVAEKSLKCDQCSFQCKTNYELRSHKLKHSDVRLYKCDQCPQMTKTMSDLTKHKRVHSLERNYICPVCNKAFGHTGSLAKHKQTHTDEKRFKCAKCPTACKTKQGLRIHHRVVHLQSKPFTCEVCKAKFSSKHNMQVHSQTHDADRPFKCPFCEYRAYDDLQVKSHIGHYHKRSYSCELCKCRFDKKFGLIQHFQTIKHKKNMRFLMPPEDQEKDVKPSLEEDGTVIAPVGSADLSSVDALVDPATGVCSIPAVIKCEVRNGNVESEMCDNSEQLTNLTVIKAESQCSDISSALNETEDTALVTNVKCDTETGDLQENSESGIRIGQVQGNFMDEEINESENKLPVSDNVSELERNTQRQVEESTNMQLDSVTHSDQSASFETQSSTDIEQVSYPELGPVESEGNLPQNKSLEDLEQTTISHSEPVVEPPNPENTLPPLVAEPISETAANTGGDDEGGAFGLVIGDVRVKAEPDW